MAGQGRATAWGAAAAAGTAPPTGADALAAAARGCRILALGLLLLALLWAPWPLGSNRQWALALLGLIIGAGVLVALLGRLLQALAGAWLARLAAAAAAAPDLPPLGLQGGLGGLQGGPQAGRALAQPALGPLSRGWWWPCLCLAGLVLLLVVQQWPGLGPGGAAISGDVFHTRVYLFNTLVYAGAWLLVLMLVRDTRQAAQVLGFVVAATVLQAAAAVLLYAGGARYELWHTHFEQGGRAMGSYPNPDHLACYMALGLCAGLGWLVAQLGQRPVQSAAPWRTRLVAGLDFLLSPKMLLRLVLVPLVVVLVMTHSRGGNGGFFIALLLVGAWVAWRSRRLRRPALWLVASMAVVDLIVIGQWVGLDRVVQRLTDTVQASLPAESAFGLAPGQPRREDGLQQRLEVPIMSLPMVLERPWLGHGGGTYYSAFAPFKQREDLPWQWNHAHNDYVEVAADLGLVGLALWLGIGVASAWRAGQMVRDHYPRVSRGVGVGALMAATYLGIHSMVDFNLHIPANALTFTVLLALVWLPHPAPSAARPGADDD